MDHVVLGHVADHVTDGPLVHVDTVEANAASRGCADACHRVEKARLAGTARAHDGDHLARLDREGHVTKHGLPTSDISTHADDVDAQTPFGQERSFHGSIVRLQGPSSPEDHMESPVITVTVISTPPPSLEGPPLRTVAW